MTTLDLKEKRCSACGMTHEYRVVLSTSRFGSPDLDTRPPMMKRATLQYEVDCCPSCGYCAQDITTAPSNATDLIKSVAYVAQQTDEAFPTLARHFLCAALIYEDGDYVSIAIWVLLRAVWVCDDANLDTQATECRQRTVALLNEKQADDPLVATARELIKADLLRRCRDFEAVETVCQRKLVTELPPSAEKIFRFQQVLARKRDAGCHTMAEAYAFTDD